MLAASAARGAEGVGMRCYGHPSPMQTLFLLALVGIAITLWSMRSDKRRER